VGEATYRKAVSYIRFSSKKQALGASLQRQIDGTRGFCQKHNLTLDESLCIRDLGVSAYKGKNSDEGNLSTFIEGVKSGKIEKGIVLCVEALDRITRQEITKAVNLFTDILLSGVDIGLVMDDKILTKDNIDKSPFELIVSTTYLIRGNDESKTKQKRVIDAVNRVLEKVKQGVPCELGGYAPPWVDYKDGAFVLDKAKVSTIKRIFSEYMVGKGTSHIVRDLVKDQVPKINSFATWRATGIRALLLNKQVTGTLKLRGQEFPAYLPAVVPIDDFNKVQLLIGKNRTRKGKLDGNINNLFNGIAKCARCNGALGVRNSTSRTKTNRYFYCLNSNDFRCKDRNTIKREDAELVIFGALLKSLPSIVLKQQDTELVRDVDRLEVELNQVENKIKDTRSLIGAVAVEELKADLIQFQGEKEIINRRLIEARVKANDNRTAPTRFFDFIKLLNADLLDQEIRRKLKNILPSIIQEIRMDLTSGDISIQLKSGEWLVIATEAQAAEMGI
jgi:DNA invertase Pin-like site-specific DNA recombinase